MGRLLALVLLAGLAGPAAACINDEESPTHEREFRSQYLASASPRDSDGRPSDGLLIGAGAALLSGAAVLTVTRARSRS